MHTNRNVGTAVVGCEQGANTRAGFVSQMRRERKNETQGRCFVDFRQTMENRSLYLKVDGVVCMGVIRS